MPGALRRRCATEICLLQAQAQRPWARPEGEPGSACSTQTNCGPPEAVEGEARKFPGARGNLGHLPWSPLLVGLGEVKAVPPGQPPLFPVWLVSVQGPRREKPRLAFLSEGFRHAVFISTILPFVRWGNPKYITAAGTTCKMLGRAREEVNPGRPGRPGGRARCCPDFSLGSLPVCFRLWFLLPKLLVIFILSGQRQYPQ